MATSVYESPVRGFAGIRTQRAPGSLAECVGSRMEVSSQTLRTPLVSVVLVDCNVDRFLAQAIESIVPSRKKPISILNRAAEAELTMSNRQ